MRLSTTTGFVKWKTEDSTDLDYSPLPLITRDNAEDDFQFTQEVRVASVRAGEAVRRRPRSDGRPESSSSRRTTSRTR